MKGLELDHQLKAYSLWGAWREVLGDTLAHHTHPSVIRNRILFVDVSHPTWIHQLQFMKSNLLQKMNAFLGEPLLQDIRFRLGKIPPMLAATPEKVTWHKEELDSEILGQIDHTLQHILDADIKKALRDLLIKGARLEKHRGKK
jgi:hypothetical protein